MNYRALAIASLCTLTTLVACGDDDETTATTTTSTTSSGSGMGGDTSSSSSSGMGGSGGGGTPVLSQVRVGHFSPGAPAVDFCLVTDGGDTIGPVLEGAGDADGIQFGDVTPYLAVPEGTYSVQIIAATDADCTADLATFDDVVVPGDINATIGAVGIFQGSPAFDLQIWVDDNTDPAAGKAHLRFIHASPDTPNVDVGALAPNETELSADIWTDVAFRAAGDPEYFETDPLTDVTVRAEANAMPTIGIDVPNVSLPAGAVATAFAIGSLTDLTSQPVGPNPLQALICVDNTGDGSCSINQ